MKITIFVVAILFMGAAMAIMSPAQQPNGQIAFTSQRDGNREIYVMNPDGTKQVRLTNNFIVDDFPDWSPDGRKIAFVSQRNDASFAVFIMNADGTGRIDVTLVNLPNPNFYSGHISWSPDGRRIAFQNAENIVVVNTDGTKRQTITNGYYPSWSPDGSKILFSTGDALYTIRPDGSDPRLVMEPTSDIYHFHDCGWSPDGQNIIFGGTYFKDFLGIFTARADGTVIRMVAGDPTQGHATTPDWSPDGRKFVYTDYTYSNHWMTNILTADINGSGYARLTTTGDNSNPSWQPLRSTKSIADFDGDGRSDVSVFRPSDSVWYLNRPTQGFAATQFERPTPRFTATASGVS